ncbi:MAG: anhydro-N-acetylmuramic acid kinase [Crocinitomicaceae bacterium]
MRVQIYGICWIFLLLERMSLHTIIGAMSGTSMDGLDLVICEIESFSTDNYSYKILNAKTFPYPASILKLLQQSKTLSAERLFELDKLLGKQFALCINTFLKDVNIAADSIDAIASHGHTIFHRPEAGYTVQIGCGITIAKETGIQVINDFRQKDVISGGQGAPLVPIGDTMLFKDRADAFLNIGGFTNISIPAANTIAFDISPGNLPLNLTALELGKPYDNGGEMARRGRLNDEILQELNALPFYQQSAPKSLGTEWLEKDFLPILHKIERPEDRLHTCSVHIAEQIIAICSQFKVKRLFITGGGAFNGFLMEQLENNGVELVIPGSQEINFKEALIFAFLGLRFLEGKYNCLASVTGASSNVCGGTLHLP